MVRRRPTYIQSDLGRGWRATADMKARIAALRIAGVDVFEALWDRHVEALRTGYNYEYADADQPEEYFRQLVMGEVACLSGSL